MQDERPCAFESRKLIPAELNCTTTEQEYLLILIIDALEIWRCYLEGQPANRLVTDHNPLVHLPRHPCPDAWLVGLNICKDLHSNGVTDLAGLMLLTQ